MVKQTDGESLPFFKLGKEQSDAMLGMQNRNLRAGQSRLACAGEIGSRAVVGVGHQAFSDAFRAGRKWPPRTENDFPKTVRKS
jgi:hypothetical protein